MGAGFRLWLRQSSCLALFFALFYGFADLFADFPRLSGVVGFSGISIYTLPFSLSFWWTLLLAGIIIADSAIFFIKDGFVEENWVKKDSTGDRWNQLVGARLIGVALGITMLVWFNNQPVWLDKVPVNSYLLAGWLVGFVLSATWSSFKTKRWFVLIAFVDLWAGIVSGLFLGILQGVINFLLLLSGSLFASFVYLLLSEVFFFLWAIFSSALIKEYSLLDWLAGKKPPRIKKQVAPSEKQLESVSTS